MNIILSKSFKKGDTYSGITAEKLFNIHHIIKQNMNIRHEEVEIPRSDSPTMALTST